MAECMWPSGAHSDLSVQHPEHSCLSPDAQSPQPRGQVQNAEPETLWVSGGDRLAESLGLALPGTPQAGLETQYLHGSFIFMSIILCGPQLLLSIANGPWKKKGSPFCGSC